MKNFKKLSRNELRNVSGGRRACSIAIQGSDGTWTTRTGSCTSTFFGILPSTCDVGLGQVELTSNGGQSHCND